MGRDRGIFGLILLVLLFIVILLVIESFGETIELEPINLTKFQLFLIMNFVAGTVAISVCGIIIFQLLRKSGVGGEVSIRRRLYLFFNAIKNKLKKV